MDNLSSNVSVALTATFIKEQWQFMEIMVAVDDVMTLRLWQVTVDDVVMNNIKSKCSFDKIKM